MLVFNLFHLSYSCNLEKEKDAMTNTDALLITKAKIQVSAKAASMATGLTREWSIPPLCQKLGVMVCGWEETLPCMPPENPTTTTIEGLRTP